MDKRLNKLPPEFIERLRRIYPRQYAAIFDSFLSKEVTTFRANCTKVDVPSLVEELKAKNVVFRHVVWYKKAFILVKPAQRDFQEYALYKEGKVYIQNLSSMLPVIVLKPCQGETILDLCAAPGGKTTQIVSEVKGQAEVVAVEKVKPRFYKLCANIKNQGQQDVVKVELADGVRVWRDYPRYFDKVLIDAPCSCEAGFLVSHPKTYSYWSYRKVKECQHKQKRLLFSGIMSLKPKGRLVYSTCTFAPEENEEVVNWALRKFGDEIYLEEIELPLRNIRGGLLEWKGRQFVPSMVSAKRIIPTEAMEGFFLACFRKR